MISLVEHDDTAPGDVHMPSNGSIVFLPVTKNDKSRDETISLKKSVKLYSALCLSEPCPGEDRKAELEECRIEDVELPVKFELVFGSKRGYAC